MKKGEKMGTPLLERDDFFKLIVIKTRDSVYIGEVVYDENNEPILNRAISAIRYSKEGYMPPRTGSGLLHSYEQNNSLKRDVYVQGEFTTEIFTLPKSKEQ